MTDPRIALSRRPAVALRHDPRRFGLAQDEDGWASVDAGEAAAG